MWRNTVIHKNEFEKMNQIAEFIIDNELRIYQKIINHHPDFHIIDTNCLHFFPKKIRSRMNYIDTSYTLGYNMENIAKMIQKYRIHTMQEYIVPAKEDPIMKHSQTRKQFSTILKNESNTINRLRTFLFQTSRSNFGLLPLTFFCSYTDKTDKTYNTNKTDNTIPYHLLHSNLAVFDKANHKWTIIEPHASLTAYSYKITSIIGSLCQYIHNFQSYQYVQPKDFTIPLNIPKEGVQNSDYLCVAWVCFLLYQMIRTKQTGISYPNWNHTLNKRRDLVNFLKMIETWCDRQKYILPTFNPEYEPYIPLNYLKAHSYLSTISSNVKSYV